MIIKKLNLLSFGKFKNKEINLTDNLNVIYGKNESGKSTVSTFIEAMLYSFPARDESRKKYFPWDNSVPSGILTLSHNDKTYNIYRSFGETPKFDTLRTEPEISLPDILPDRETYRKSVYCAEGKASDFDRTSGMDSRIANIMATGDESINATLALSRLSEKRKELTRQRGSGALLQQVEARITELENELSISRIATDMIKSQKDALSNKEETISELKKEISDYEEKIRDCEASLVETDSSISSQLEYIAALPPQDKKDAEKSPGLPLIFLSLLAFVCLLAVGIGFFMPLAFLSVLPLTFCIGSLFIHFKKSKSMYKNVSDADYREAYSDLATLEKEKSQFTEKISHLREKITLLQRDLIELNEQRHTLDKDLVSSNERSEDEIASNLSYMYAQRDEIVLKIKAIDAAIEAIEYAKTRFSEDFTPIVTKKAAEYIALIAPKEGRSITLLPESESKKKELGLSVKDPLHRSFSAFSFGFRQEVYLCLRLALSDFLFSSSMPIIIDDPFLGSDDYREKAIIDLLSHIAKNKQVIIFTNRKNDYFNQLNCNFVDMSTLNDV